MWSLFPSISVFSDLIKFCYHLSYQLAFATLEQLIKIYYNIFIQIIISVHDIIFEAVGQAVRYG
jgi:hypothetical protein